MRRAIQIFAILLSALLTAAPLSAAAGCAISNMASACPMGMAGMDADCPMAQNAVAGDCSMDCCHLTAPQAAVVAGVLAKPKLPVHGPEAVQLPMVATAEADASVAPVSAAAASSPPRHVLLRVFRI